MTAHRWKCIGISRTESVSETAKEIEKRLNALEEDGWEVFSVFDEEDALVVLARKPM